MEWLGVDEFTLIFAAVSLAAGSYFEAIFRVVAAILHLGNINFVKGDEIDSSAIKDEKSRFHLNMTAELLRCDASSLEDALIKRVMVTPEEVITITLDPINALSSRDALAKTTYSRLFDWIVEKINNSIGQDPLSKSIIGVLDIYGFESFKFNRLEEKVSNLESENQVLRQQALAISPTAKSLSARPKTTIIQRTPENGNVMDGEFRRVMALVPVPYTPESEAKPQKFLNEKQQENQDLLIKCISQDLGFSKGRPVAACLIYKSLLQWRSFKLERTNIFDRIIQTIASAIEGQESTDILAY